MFDDIIDLSKIGQGVVDETQSVVNLVEVIDSEIERNADVSRSRERLFSGRISHGVPIKGITNEQVLRKAIRNLLANAIRYTPKGGKIFLAARWRNDRLTIDVMDQGCGISRNFVSHMFEPFERESSNRKDSGSGLGLYIVKSSLTSLGGDVHLMRSEINKGSWFRVELPIREPSRPAASDASHGKNLWILHDDPKTARAVHARISHCQFDEIKQFSKLQDVITLIRHLNQPTILLIGGSESIGQFVLQDGLMKPPIYPVMMDSRSHAGIMTMENKMWAGQWSDVSIRRIANLVRQIDEQIVNITQPQIVRKIRTLLVDDEPLNLEYLPDYLANGLSLDQSMIATAKSAAVALQLLEANPYDLVIVDYQMPEMNGLELAERIRAKWPQVVVAGISANVTEQVKQQFYDLGVDIFIGRPPKEYQLAALVAKFNENNAQTTPQTKRTPDQTDLEGKLRTRILKAKADIADAMGARDVARVRSLTHAIEGACSMMGREDLASLFVEAQNMAINEEWNKSEEMINEIG